MLGEESPLSRAESRGGEGRGVLAALLSRLGCNLKGDETAAPRSSRAEPSSLLVISASPHSQPAPCLLPSKNHFSPESRKMEFGVTTSQLCRIPDMQFTKMGQFHIWTTAGTFQWEIRSYTGKHGLLKLEMSSPRPHADPVTLGATIRAQTWPSSLLTSLRGLFLPL